MKSATFVAVMLAALSSFPLIAKQQEPAQPQPEPQQTTPAPPQQPEPQTTPAPPPSAQPGQQPDQNGNATQQSNPATPGNAAAAPAKVEMQPVKGELEKKLDTKSAKAGDSVVVKTKESVKIADGTEIPKGSKLVGRVTNVQPVGEGRQNSQVAIQFDHAEVKGGQNVPIESVIQSVSPAETAAAAEQTPSYGGAPSASPSSSAPSGSASGGMNNGGMNNGTSNRPSGTMTGTPPQSPAQPGSAAGSAGMGSSESQAGRVVTTRGNVAIRTTAIPGVLLANSVNGQPFSNAAGLLLGAKQDVKLDSGTQMVVAVAAAQPGQGTTPPQGSGSPTPNQ